MFFAGSGWGIGFPLAQRGPQPSRWGQAVSWRLCRLETARALWVLCCLGWGVSLAGKTYFSFVGKRDVFTLRWFLPAQLLSLIHI